MILGARRLEAAARPGRARRGGRGGGWRPRSFAAGAPRGPAADEALLSPLLTPIAVEVSAELGRLPRRLRDRDRAHGCASGCSPSSVCRCRRCGCAPARAGLSEGKFVIRLNEVPLARGEIARDEWGVAGGRAGRRGAGAAAPLRARAVRAGGGAGAARRARADAPGAGPRGGPQAGLAGALHRHRPPPGRGGDLAPQPARHPGRARRVGAARARSGGAHRARPRRAPPRDHPPLCR